MKQSKAIFLDRDGVLNHTIVKDGKPYPPASVAELTIFADALATLTQLKAAGYMLIGATNQPDVARGNTPKATVEAINHAIMTALPIDDMLVCYHDDTDGCECRKPLPGLLLKAAKTYDIALNKSVMIGDRWKDVAAGQAAGCKTVWLNHGYQEQKPIVAPDFEARTLSQSVEWLLNNPL